MVHGLLVLDSHGPEMYKKMSQEQTRLDCFAGETKQYFTTLYTLLFFVDYRLHVTISFMACERLPPHSSFPQRMTPDYPFFLVLPNNRHTNNIEGIYVSCSNFLFLHAVSSFS
jgi:hypothetical protein